ncbi:MAG: hypothetical protein PUB54_06330 [Lachnospiraceae bacterium]|nr:hypothetical protein [Lachnospiraceae bacterium]
MKLFKRMVFVVCLLTMLGVVAVPPIMAKAEDGSTKDLGKGYIIVTDNYMELVDEDDEYVSSLNGYTLSDLGVSYDSANHILKLENANFSSSNFWGAIVIESYTDITIECKGRNALYNPAYHCICNISDTVLTLTCKNGGNLKMQSKRAAFLLSDVLEIKNASLNITSNDMAFQGCDRADIVNSSVVINCKNGYGDTPNIMSSWIKKDGWSYYTGDGSKATGWMKDGNTWYYFDAAGTMKTGWLSYDNKWYYMGTNGAMTTGWQKVDGKWYYLGTNGVMVTGWQKVDGKWYYFSSSGAMVTGWKQIGNNWYYFEPSGAMVTGWQKISNKWYYFEPSGVMVTGWQKINDKWYYFEAGGAMVKGWKQISGKWYYFESSGAMVIGTQKIDGKTYTFHDNGVWIK